MWQVYNGDKKIIFNEMMMRPALFEFHGASLLRQQSDRDVVPLGHIIWNPGQCVFHHSPSHWVLKGETPYTNLIVFVLAQSRIIPTNYQTWGEHANHYTTDADPMFGHCIVFYYGFWLSRLWYLLIFLIQLYWNSELSVYMVTFSDYQSHHCDWWTILRRKWWAVIQKGQVKPLGMGCNLGTLGGPRDRNSWQWCWTFIIRLQLKLNINNCNGSICHN